MEKQRKKPEKRPDSAPLDALRLVLRSHAIELKPFVHQVKDLPQDPDLEYYFVPAELKETYRPYYRPGRPYKNLKLVNFDQPAISLSFYFKHKYSIKQDVPADQAIEYLRNYRDELFNKGLLIQPSQAEQLELKQVDDLLRQIRTAPGHFQYCFSNFHHFYRYWYCSYRYFEEEKPEKLGSATEHLLKHSERVKGQVSQRLNIIFVDTEYIARAIPLSQDNKTIEKILATYNHRHAFGTVALYVKPSANNADGNK
ncbi:hypothetical protein [Nibrella saemangeumensis]